MAVLSKLARRAPKVIQVNEYAGGVEEARAKISYPPSSGTRVCGKKAEKPRSGE